MGGGEKKGQLAEDWRRKNSWAGRRAAAQLPVCSYRFKAAALVSRQQKITACGVWRSMHTVFLTALPTEKAVSFNISFGFAPERNTSFRYLFSLKKRVQLYPDVRNTRGDLFDCAAVCKWYSRHTSTPICTDLFCWQQGCKWCLCVLLYMYAVYFLYLYPVLLLKSDIYI